MNKDIIYTYQNKLITTKKDIEESIKTFNGTFLEKEYIANNILELIKLSDSFSNNQYTRCKDILNKAIYVLFKFKGNDFDIKDLYNLITNPGGHGRMIINKFLRLPSKTEEEQKENLDVATFFLNDFFEKENKNKKESNIYTKDVILLSYYLNELIEVNSKIEKPIDNSIDDDII